MVDQLVIREWLKKADDDFGFASTNLREKRTEHYDLICFHFQQAVEKYLKAFVVARELKFEKIHDLETLRKICAAVDSVFEGIKEECLFLNDFYIEARYPMIWPVNFTSQDTDQAMAAAEKIGSLVKKLLH